MLLYSWLLILPRIIVILISFTKKKTNLPLLKIFYFVNIQHFLLHYSDCVFEKNPQKTQKQQQQKQKKVMIILQPSRIM